MGILGSAEDLLPNVLGVTPTRECGRQGRAGEAVMLLPRRPQLTLRELWDRHSPSELCHIEAMQGLGPFWAHVSQSVAISSPLEREAKDAQARSSENAQGSVPGRNSAVSPQQPASSMGRDGFPHMKEGPGKAPLLLGKGVCFPGSCLLQEMNSIKRQT